MTVRLDIIKKRGDKRRITFRIWDKKGNIDITNWTGFRLVVDPSQTPVDDVNNVMEVVGNKTDAANGRVSFPPDGLVAVGNYFYDAEALDDNSELVTFSTGKYNVVQDIAK